MWKNCEHKLILLTQNRCSHRDEHSNVTISMQMCTNWHKLTKCHTQGYRKRLRRGSRKRTRQTSTISMWPTHFPSPDAMHGTWYAGTCAMARWCDSEVDNKWGNKWFGLIRRWRTAWWTLLGKILPLNWSRSIRSYTGGFPTRPTWVPAPLHGSWKASSFLSKNGGCPSGKELGRDKAGAALVCAMNVHDWHQTHFGLRRQSG